MLLFCNTVHESTIIKYIGYFYYIHASDSLVSKTQAYFICKVNQTSKKHIVSLLDNAVIL